MPCAAYIQLVVHPGEYCLLFHVCFCVFSMVALSLAACGIIANPLIVFVFRLWLTLVASLSAMRNSRGKTWEEKQLHR